MERLATLSVNATYLLSAADNENQDAWIQRMRHGDVDGLHNINARSTVLPATTVGGWWHRGVRNTLNYYQSKIIQYTIFVNSHWEWNLLPIYMHIYIYIRTYMYICIYVCTESLCSLVTYINTHKVNFI